MRFSLVEYGSPEYDEMVILREKILRYPLGLSFSVDELVAEKEDVFMACFDDLRIVGCCIFTPFENVVKLRQMAVSSDKQRSGVGTSLIRFAENIAKELLSNKIVLNARDEAISFYEKLGYAVEGESFIEVGIPHVKMLKLIQ